MSNVCYVDTGLGLLAHQVPPTGRKPVQRRDVLGLDRARREARRRRAKRRALKQPRASHLVQLGPYGHRDRRPRTEARMDSRRARCSDCWGAGVRVHLVERQLGPVVRVPVACGCVRA